MRPLKHPPLEISAQGNVSMAAMALQVFGPFCAVSERCLPAAHTLWNAREHRAVNVDQPVNEEWRDCLLLDQTTFGIIEHKPRPEGLLLPHEQITFSLHDSPFRYDLELVKVALLDEDGAVMADPEEQDLVIVSATTERAQRTIDFFALNGAGYDPEKNRLSIKRLDYLSMVDHRIFERTEAWQRALHVAAGIEEANDIRTRQFLAEQARLVVAASGFWSVWATVFWRAFADLDLVASMLVQQPRELEKLRVAFAESNRTFVPEILGHGPDNCFPGTHPDWQA